MLTGPVMIDDLKQVCNICSSLIMMIRCGVSCVGALPRLASLSLIRVSDHEASMLWLSWSDLDSSCLNLTQCDHREW